MPTYDYRCKACEHEFELFQTMSASPKRKCPRCSKLRLERLIGTGAAVIFKGSGFYQTDYRSESYKKAAKADKQKTSDTASSSSDRSSSTNKSSSGKSSGSKPESKSKGSTSTDS